MDITSEEQIDLNISLLNALSVQVAVATDLQERKRKLQMLQKVTDATIRLLEAL